MTPEVAARLGTAYGTTLPKGSFVLAGRDAIRSSRMLKRSFVGGLLSAGVNVRDVRMISLPVLRYKLTTFGEVGAIHFRQSPEDPAATEAIFFDGEGNEISSAAAKGIERIYFKENFRRAHHAEPGGIEELPRIYDFYCEGFLRALDREALRRAAPRIVVDLNHSPAANLLPELLADLGFDVTELNSHVHEKGIDCSVEALDRALDQLGRIVVTLGADAGFWIGPSGERVHIVDATGRIYRSWEALGLLTALVCRAKPGGSLVVPVAAPQAVNDLARAAGVVVLRTPADGRSLTEAGRDRQVRMIAAPDGRFGFPAFQPHFDGLFTIAKTMELCSRTGLTLAQAAASVPQRTYLHQQVPCPREFKGGLMRRMSEAAVDQQATFIDGVRIDTAEGWVQVVPDQHRPLTHIFAEAIDPAMASQACDRYRDLVTAWVEEMARG
jgi:mannose-1-phosphate guanylyltransferase/phosphomannomutase